MTIKFSKETRNLMAQCDECLDVVDFKAGEDFDDAKAAIDKDGWITKRGEGGKWINICCDCK